MGVVYLGKTAEGAPVAIKTIRDVHADDDAFRARFRRELDATLRVGGRYVARVVDADLTGTVPYFVTEYIAGETLSERVISNGTLSDESLRALAAGLAAGMAELHEAGIAHRDLTPRNVVLSSTGPKIIDLGIASVREATRMTATGTSMGTPSWMAPEHALGDKVGAPADVFAWGGLVLFAATGAPPFGEGRPEAVLYRIVHDRPDTSRLAPPLRDLVEAALSKDPSARPTALRLVGRLTGTSDDLTTAAETAATMLARTNLAATASLATEVPPESDAPTGDSPTVETPVGAPPRRRQARIRRRAAIIAMCAAILAGSATVALRGDRAARSEAQACAQLPQVIETTFGIVEAAAGTPEDHMDMYVSIRDFRRSAGRSDNTVLMQAAEQMPNDLTSSADPAGFALATIQVLEGFEVGRGECVALGHMDPPDDSPDSTTTAEVDNADAPADGPGDSAAYCAWLRDVAALGEVDPEEIASALRQHVDDFPPEQRAAARRWLQDTEEVLTLSRADRSAMTAEQRDQHLVEFQEAVDRNSAMFADLMVSPELAADWCGVEAPSP